MADPVGNGWKGFNFLSSIGLMSLVLVGFLPPPVLLTVVLVWAATVFVSGLGWHLFASKVYQRIEDDKSSMDKVKPLLDGCTKLGVGGLRFTKNKVSYGHFWHRVFVYRQVICR